MGKVRGLSGIALLRSWNCFSFLRIMSNDDTCGVKVVLMKSFIKQLFMVDKKDEISIMSFFILSFFIFLLCFLIPYISLKRPPCLWALRFPPPSKASSTRGFMAPRAGSPAAPRLGGSLPRPNALPTQGCFSEKRPYHTDGGAEQS